MYSARDNEGHLKVCLTLIFKVNYRGQVTYFSHNEIPNIGYVQIDRNIVSSSRIQPMMNKRSQKVTLTLIFKVILWGQVKKFWWHRDTCHLTQWNRHVDLVYIIYTTKNKEIDTIVNLTLILKVNCQGHVINFGLFDITDLDLVRIDTKIKSVSCIQPKITKVI